MIIADTSSYDFRYSDSASKNVVGRGGAHDTLIQCLSRQVGIERCCGSLLGADQATIRIIGVGTLDPVVIGRFDQITGNIPRVDPVNRTTSCDVLGQQVAVRVVGVDS